MNIWQEIYSADEYVYGVQPNEFLLEHYELFKGSKKLATFAEGEGRNAVFLSTKGYMLTNFDYAQHGLDKSRKLASINHVHVASRLVDLTKDDTPVNEFDGAVMIFGHFPKKYQKLVFDKIIASVKAGGYILMELYSEEQVNYASGGPKDRDMLFNSNDIQKWCSPFKMVHFSVGEVERHEGIRHNGKSHVIQFIIKK
ncbi:MAG: class I SAM-dependent methyltransferase [Kurthia sp.]|nr:class I SAM-dependent methyltransferase [Candidatus Kurthia equi]